MKRGNILTGVAISALLVTLSVTTAMSAQDRNTVKVEGGLGFADFRGYEGWQVISMSQNHGLFAVILGNPAMIAALKSGIPDNGKPFPDGAKMAKIHWNPKTNETAPGQPLVPDTLHDVDFMWKDAKRFADSNGWGYAAFQYQAASDSFSPSDQTSSPPQGHDAKCGAACHTAARDRDYVFTKYPKR